MFRESFKDLIRKPALAIPGFVLWLLILILSKISVAINYRLTNSVNIISWLVVFGLVLFGMMAFIFSGLIGLSERTIRRKKFGVGEFLVFGKKYWLANLIVTAFILVCTVLIGRAAHFLASGVGERFNLAYGTALFIFIFIYFVGLVGGLIWFTFGSFMVVLKNKSAWGGVKESARFVKREYLAVLGLHIMLFIFFWIGRNLEEVVFELIEYGIVVPYLALLMGRFVLGARQV